MNKVIVAALVAAAGLCAGTAHAANVSWSVGIDIPVIGGVVSDAPFNPVPVYVRPQMVAPLPGYELGYMPGYAASPARVVYPGRGVAYRPVPVVYMRGHDEYRRHHGWDRDDRGERHRGRRD